MLQGGCLSSLQEKLKYTKDGFCCLVVTSASEPDTVRGVVEISLQGEKVSGTASLLGHRTSEPSDWSSPS